MVQKTDQFGFIKGDSEFNRKRLEDIIKNLNIDIALKDGINVPSEQTDNFINQANQFGVSGTNMNALGFGGLNKFIPQAQNIYTKLLSKSPEQQAKEDRINTGLLFLNFFSNLGAQSSQPGATGLGATNLAIQDTANKYIQQVEANRKRKDAERKGVVNLAMQLKTAKDARDLALGKAKRGAPKTVEFGPAMEDGKPKMDEKGNQLFKYNVYDPLGKIIQTYEAPRKGGMTVNVGDKSAKKFGEVFSTSQAKKFGEQLDASSAAMDGMQTIDTLLNLLADPDFETGPWEEFKVNLKAIGLSFGLFANDDKTIDNIASAEAFRAKAYSIVLDSVSKMKGALSDKELGFLSAQGPTLSKTTEGNKLLLYLNKHQLDKAAKFRSFVIDWSDKNNAGQFPEDGSKYNRMIDDWKNSDSMKLNPYQYIQSEAEKFERELISNMGGTVNDNGDLVPGSLDSDPFKEQEKIKQIVEQVSNKFSLRLLKKVFKNSGFM